MKPLDMLAKTIARNPIRSQREACTVAARRSIAAFGPARTEEAIRSTCKDLTKGLFGEAYAAADATERDRMLALMEEEYRKCAGCAHQ